LADPRGPLSRWTRIPPQDIFTAELHRGPEGSAAPGEGARDTVTGGNSGARPDQGPALGSSRPPPTTPGDRLLSFLENRQAVRVRTPNGPRSLPFRGPVNRKQLTFRNPSAGHHRQRAAPIRCGGWICRRRPTTGQRLARGWVNIVQTPAHRFRKKCRSSPSPILYGRGTEHLV